MLKKLFPFEVVLYHEQGPSNGGESGTFSRGPRSEGALLGPAGAYFMFLFTVKIGPVGKTCPGARGAYLRSGRRWDISLYNRKYVKK